MDNGQRYNGLLFGNGNDTPTVMTNTDRLRYSITDNDGENNDSKQEASIQSVKL